MHRITTMILAAMALSAPLAVNPAWGNDALYPSAPAAEAAISLTGTGFTIKGRPTYIASGSIHYPRVPRALWRDRLLRLKRAGFNTVETYAFWNYHEPQENAWDFSGEKDIAAFLDTAKDLGLYAIVRVGPYVCAEWDSGGYPIWLKFKPPFKVRTADPAFLAFNDHWYDRILPIVAAHQIHKGGNVILVQLENEHPKGWGTVSAPYFDHLREKAVALGIEVPFFFSGLNHGHGPKPGTSDPARRATPWFSTEFWSGWFDRYGPLDGKRVAEIERDNWRILANGGGGHNFYMLHGGSNFETWNDNSGAASYDYGAAIGQGGDLRPLYYRMKRANQFAQLLPALRAGGAAVTYEVNSATSIRKAPLPGGLMLNECTARLLGAVQQGSTITVVVYGPAGDTGHLAFPDKDLTVTFPDGGCEEQSFTSAGHAVRVVAMDTAVAARTWFIDDEVVCGPAFVGERSAAGMTIERPYGQPSCGKVIVYGAKVQHLAVVSDGSVDTAPAPKLEPWQMRPAPEAAAATDDAQWKASEDPQQMGADGDISAFAWYRAVVEAPAAGAGKLHFSASADHAVVLVNGLPGGEFRAGRNVIAVLTSHHGREKAFNYTGSLDNYFRKGLSGPVRLELAGQTLEVKGWKMRGGVGQLEGAWQPVAASSGVPAFYRSSFTCTPMPGRVLRVVSRGLTRGTVWINGHNAGRYPEKIKANGLYLPECWLKDGVNSLVVFDEEGAVPAQDALIIETAASREVIQVSAPCDATTRLIVPSEAKPVDVQKENARNLAFRKPTTASSSEKANGPGNANDGDPDTRWCAASGSTPQWWQVDLGAPQDLHGCEIMWEADGRLYQYLVEGSADAQTWTTLSDQRQTTEQYQIQKLAFTAKAIRHVRITVTGLPKEPLTWASIREVRIDAAPAPAPAPAP